MRTASLVLAAACFVFFGCDAREDRRPDATGGSKDAGAAAITAMEVDAACGECQFHMQGAGCDLAVRIDGKPYFVTGTKLDDHGDAHAKDGFCNAVRRALVTGRVEGDRFLATSFQLLPAIAKK